MKGNCGAATLDSIFKARGSPKALGGLVLRAVEYSRQADLTASVTSFWAARQVSWLSGSSERCTTVYSAHSVLQGNDPRSAGSLTTNGQSGLLGLDANPLTALPSGSKPIGIS